MHECSRVSVSCFGSVSGATALGVCLIRLGFTHNGKNMA
jgi:hypothetical protein